MANPKLVDTRLELRNNVIKFAKDVPTLAAKPSKLSSAIANGCSHAVEWVAFPDGVGGWSVAFSKYAGYNGLTFQIYDQLRKTNLTGTDTKRRVEKLGGVYHNVGANAGGSSSHPAVVAVHAMCALFGKTAKTTAKVRVFPDETRPAWMDILVAAIRAAKLTDAEITSLVAEVKAA